VIPRHLERDLLCHLAASIFSAGEMLRVLGEPDVD
jgi:hypothetical protein